MKSRNDAEMVSTFKEVYEELKTKERQPTLYVLDNEYSKVVKNYIIVKQTNEQLVEPHNHRVNAAEPAVKACSTTPWRRSQPLTLTAPYNYGANSQSKLKSP